MAKIVMRLLIKVSFKFTKLFQYQKTTSSITTMAARLEQCRRAGHVWPGNINAQQQQLG